MKKNILFLLVLFSVMWVGSAVDAAIIVGRITNVEGQINRYMAVDDSWVATSLQAPAGTKDILATGDESRAEITFSNSQLVRLDEDTEIEILNLDDDIGEFGLYSGLARFYNRSSAGKLLIETTRGTATVEPGSAIDVLVDKKSVTVSAVHGEAVFRSFQDGVESEETISGSTSLEFREKSIIAGKGSIDRKWDRWCEDREAVSAQNRLVSSEHLPESMQKYAYAVEPYGRWQRIYYRGYNYWAWKPHSVTAGWSPYTTGYWEDWHGSSVWVDYNPWGWTTHHHGHWLNMHGAWLWTPYVHVANVPGITAIGFNITFGKRYRSQWHPGRVRWIAHNDYIGWLPLAPWETYYGYRKWGPRTVVLQGGSGFSININLSSHKHIKHAVIIPRQHLYHRKPGVVNNYNKVKVRNVHKTIIVKNYKPLRSAERSWKKKHATKVTINKNIEKRSETRRVRNTEKIRKNIRSKNQEKQKERSVLSKRSTSKERNVIGKNYSKRTIKNKRVVVRDKPPREKVVRDEQRIHERTVEKKEKTTVKNRVAANHTQRESLPGAYRSRIKGNKSKEAQPESIRKRSIKKESKSAGVQKNEGVGEKRTEKESRLSQKKVKRNQNRDKQISKEENRKKRGKEDLEKENGERQTAGNSRSIKRRSTARENRENKQRSGRDWSSASLNSFRFR